MRPVQLTAATGARHPGHLERPTRRQVAVIDLIQTMWLDTVDSTPGDGDACAGLGAGAGRACQRARHRACCWSATSPRTAQIAGPRVLEHMVDTVLYFEGERGHQFRILRAVKNRFGPTDEIGVFEMSDRGLRRGRQPVGAVPRRARAATSPAPAVFAGIEGTRPVLVEIQALVAPSTSARRAAPSVGWDRGRLAMVLAVLERAAASASAPTTSISAPSPVAIRIGEPAADLP